MKFFLSIMLLLSLLLNCFLTGCCLVSEHSKVTHEIENLAQKYDITLEGKSSVELLKEIDNCNAEKKDNATQRGEMTKYFGSYLTEDEWSFIRLSLTPRPGTIETLEKYDYFIKSIGDKKLLIYQDEE